MIEEEEEDRIGSDRSGISNVPVAIVKLTSSARNRPLLKAMGIPSLVYQ